MKVIITGASGFLGSRLADALLKDSSSLPITQLVLTDYSAPPSRNDPRVTCIAADLTSPDAAALITPDTAVLFHLAAVVSGAAEADFDFGMRVNMDATRTLLERARYHAPNLRFIYASSVGAYGGKLPAKVDEYVATTPETSYGAAKVISEKLVNEYSRRGFVDGVSLRLPTVTVRAGAANAAVTSFASGLVREPMNGEPCVVPVPPELELWVCSPRAVVQNLMHAAIVPAKELGAWRAVNLPGLRVSVQQMVAALRAVAGDEIANRVSYKLDKKITAMVASFPIEFDVTKAMRLGFRGDSSFEDNVRDYIENNFNKNK